MVQVVVVDDEKIERDGMEFLLQRYEHPMQIHKMCNGSEALEFLRRQNADLVITDIKMPVMDGLALCREARAPYPDIHLLISSGYGEFEFAQQAIQAKVDDYILKPVIVDNFYRIVGGIFCSLEQRSRTRQHRLEQRPRVASCAERDAALPRLNDTSLAEDEQDTARKKAIQLAIQLIRENYHRDISLEWIAQQIYLSPGYLSGLFHKETGRSVIQYITLCRMEKARDYLTQTNMKIVDIAGHVGYSNSSYFCLQFRKHYGMTAVQMREGKGADLG